MRDPNQQDGHGDDTTACLVHRPCPASTSGPRMTSHSTAGVVIPTTTGDFDTSAVRMIIGTTRQSAQNTTVAVGSGLVSRTGVASLRPPARAATMPSQSAAAAARNASARWVLTSDAT